MNDHNNHDERVIDTVAEILNAASPMATRMSVRRRRLLRALDDLGLLDAVGDDFVHIADNGLEFTTLDDRRSDRLVNLLEDLATRAPRRANHPARTQLTLGDD